MLPRPGPRGRPREPGQPSDLREHNARRLLAGLRDLGPRSRPELARHLGLSAVTIASIAQGLVEAGALIEAGTRGNGVGRRAVVLDVAPDAGAAFVADVQLDAVRWQRVGPRGDVRAGGTFALPGSVEALVDALAATGGMFQVQLTVDRVPDRETASWIIGLLALVLRDLHQGRLWLGHGGSRGHGLMQLAGEPVWNLPAEWDGVADKLQACVAALLEHLTGEKAK